MIRPVSTFGQDTFSSSIETSSRCPTAATSRASSSRPKPITETTSGTGSCASSGRSEARKPSRPLFGRPIELIIPAGVSHNRGGGLPCRGSRVIVFDTNASNGKRSSRASPNARRAAMASKVPEPFRTGPRSATPQSSMPLMSGRPREQRGLEVIRVQHGPVQAEAHVAVLGGHHTSETGTEAARHARLERELGRHAALRAESAHGFEHRRRPTGIDGPARVGIELSREQFGHERLAPDRAVVGDNPGLPGEQRRCLGVLRAAEAEQDGRLVELLLKAKQRSGADTSADEDRPKSVGRRAEPDPERPHQGQAGVGRELRQPLRAGTDRLEQEAERHAVGLHVRPGVREGPRKVRTLVASPTPAVLRGEHVELARPRVPWAGGVVGSYEVVGAEPLDTGDDRHTPLGGRERPRLAQVVRSASTARSKAPPCSS